MTCACGCGEQVKAGCCVVWGHNLKSWPRVRRFTSAQLLERQRDCAKRLRAERRARGECACCGADSPRFYSCRACRVRANARKATRAA